MADCGGPCHCFGKDNSAEALSWAILFKAGPPANANVAQGCLVFLYISGMSWWPSHASRSVCFIYFLQAQDPFLVLGSF